MGILCEFRFDRIKVNPNHLYTYKIKWDFYMILFRQSYKKQIICILTKLNRNFIWFYFDSYSKPKS